MANLQFELAEGSEDKEAQSALAELKEKMGALAVAEAAASSSKSEATDDAAVPDDLQLASVVDRSSARDLTTDQASG